jgi:RING finger protein 121
VGVAGYVMLLLDLFGVGLLLVKLIPQGTSLVLLWYGLYFGILGRDCAEVASGQIVSEAKGPKQSGCMVRQSLSSCPL